jgi:hypothetical protein
MARRRSTVRFREGAVWDHLLPSPSSRTYLSIWPASTGSVMPVTYLDSSEASHRTALEISAGSTHGIGMAFRFWNRGASASLVGSAAGRSGANTS